MENIHEINQKIAKNLIYYRKAAGLTQAELAEKINYSDKSVSKWEQGNGVPDVYVLMKLAKLYRVSINDLLSEAPPENALSMKKTRGLKVLIILLSSGIVWLVATLIFTTCQLVKPQIWKWWLVFLYAVVVNAVLLIVYASRWKYRVLNFISVTILIWTTLTSLFLTILFLPENVGLEVGGLWCLFLLGVPLQALEILWVFFRSLFRKNKAKYIKEKEIIITQEEGEVDEEK